jgi:hypothetical protein
MKTPKERRRNQNNQINLKQQTQNPSTSRRRRRGRRRARTSRGGGGGGGRRERIREKDRQISINFSEQMTKKLSFFDNYHFHLPRTKKTEAKMRKKERKKETFSQKSCPTSRNPISIRFAEKNTQNLTIFLQLPLYVPRCQKNDEKMRKTEKAKEAFAKNSCCRLRTPTNIISCILTTKNGVKQ